MATWRGFDCRLARESGAWSLAWAFQSGDFCYGNLERNKGCMDYSGPPNPRALQSIKCRPDKYLPSPPELLPWLSFSKNVAVWTSSNIDF